jgi:hypothetical protein
MRHMVSRVLAVAAVLTAVLAFAPLAGASISPSVSLNQSAGKTAGSEANLGLDLKFAPTGTDSPHNLTISLPPGLLADAAINGGSCLKAADTSGTPCEVGSGQVTATADPIPGLLNLPVPVTVPVTFYLVPPPAPGDLAGLAVEGLGEQIGQTGDINVRPSGDPNGVGVTISLALPDQLPLTLPGIGEVPTASISLTEINSTFDSLRYPATCPSTPARVSVSADSYADSTTHGATAPLPVTGCSALAYAPAFRVSATRDSGDRQVRLGTTVTQTATQAPSRSVILAFPSATLAPNLESITALCLNLSSGTCQTVGSASATSPLYPATLTGKAYLTGSSSGLSLTLVFPSPFPLTLTGSVDLLHNSATFTGLPDIPLTNLGVTLNGGTDGLFLSTCAAPSGTATATLTSQNGDKTVSVPGKFTVAGCPGISGAGGSGAGGSGGSGSGGTASSNGSSAAGVTVGHTNLSRGRFSGLRSGHPALTFKIRTAKGAAKLRALTVELPAGLRFVARRHRVAGVTVGGAAIKSLSLSRGHLTIVFRRAVSSLAVTVKSAALTESRSLKARAKKRALKALRLAVITQTVQGKRTTIRAQIKSLGL